MRVLSSIFSMSHRAAFQVGDFVKLGAPIPVFPNRDVCLMALLIGA